MLAMGGNALDAAVAGAGVTDLTSPKGVGALLAMGGNALDDEDGVDDFAAPKGVGALLAMGGNALDAALVSPNGSGALLAIGKESDAGCPPPPENENALEDEGLATDTEKRKGNGPFPSLSCRSVADCSFLVARGEDEPPISPLLSMTTLVSPLGLPALSLTVALTIAST